MASDKYLSLKINNQDVDIKSADDLPFGIDYSLENSNNFQTKESSRAIEVTIPATLNNDRIFSSFHDANIEDEKAKKAMDCLMIESGMEIFKGKSLLSNSSEINDKPSDYKLDCYGNNGDWLLPLKEKTLHDFVSRHTHVLNSSGIISSWMYFDGQDEEKDFVYAPVRYGKKFSENDNLVKVTELKPSISIYWIIWRAFKSLGYKIESNFLDTEYFRRRVMPWTWGDFLFMDSSKLDPLKFKATGTIDPPGNATYSGNSRTSFLTGGNTTFNWWLGALPSGSSIYQDTFELKNDQPPLGFDNGGNYSVVSNISLYYFNPAQAALLGISDIVFEITIPAQLRVSSTVGSDPDSQLFIDWTISGGGASGSFLIYNGTSSFVVQNETKEFTVPGVEPGKTIAFTFRYHYNGGNSSASSVVQIFSRFTQNFSGTGKVLREAFFRVKTFKKAEGSIVDFTLYDEFKNHKFLDFFAGVCDTFDLVFQTDPINKTIRIEPFLPYYLNNDSQIKKEGYFNNGLIDWSQKRDLSKVSGLNLFRDSEQLLEFKFKNDGNDGGVKIFNERNSQTAGLARYFFPDRFKEGKKDFENRFFAPVVHINMEQWGKYSPLQTVPQIIALIPENIANTSANEAQYKLLPRIAYFKEYSTDSKNGRINFEGILNPDGTSSFPCPEMFAVNYQEDGENDPVTTYNDQNINGQVVHGLMRRFFLPRLAVQRYGKRKTEYFNLNSEDIRNWMHREKININNAQYLLININGYMPTKEESTECTLWKYFPITQEDSINCFPSISSVETGVTISGNDIRYQRLLLLQTDIYPQTP